MDSIQTERHEMIVRFAFYKPLFIDWIGQLISRYTHIFNWGTPRYSHVEIGFLIDGEWKYYSSSSRNKDGTSGTRWISEKDLLRHPERWDVYEAEAVRSLLGMTNDCDYELGKAYDWWGIFSFVTLFGQLNSKRKWYCSEICNYIFFGAWKKRISPRRLFSKLKKYDLINYP